MAATPDPVAEAAEYQRFLLSLLGDRDPFQVQAGTVEALREIFAEAGDRIRERPSPEDWSVLEIAGHILDAEVACTGRYRWIIAHDEPPLPGYDQDRWVERLRHNEDDPEELLSFFEALRVANLALWERTSEAERARVGMHMERGPESLELMFRLYAGHDINHLGQARRVLP